MMPSSSRQTVPERLCWSGALTQAMSMELGGELLVAFRERNELILNLAGVTSLDLSCLVLLCAIKRQSNEKGKMLLLEGLENPVVAVVVRQYRNNGNRLCRTYCGDSCLFDGEKE